MSLPSIIAVGVVFNVLRRVHALGLFGWRVWRIRFGRVCRWKDGLHRVGLDVLGLCEDGHAHLHVVNRLAGEVVVVAKTLKHHGHDLTKITLTRSGGMLGKNRALSKHSLCEHPETYFKLLVEISSPTFDVGHLCLSVANCYFSRAH